jgi:hypothetical protein
LQDDFVRLGPLAPHQEAGHGETLRANRPGPRCLRRWPVTPCPLRTSSAGSGRPEAADERSRPGHNPPDDSLRMGVPESSLPPGRVASRRQATGRFATCHRPERPSRAGPHPPQARDR